MLQVEEAACAKAPGSGASSMYSWNSLKNLKSGLVVAWFDGGGEVGSCVAFLVVILRAVGSH